jgi:hypothetical protein
LHTWDPVSIESTNVLVRVFQNLIVLSWDPPPEANNPCKLGFQAIALTAAVWLLNFEIGIEDLLFQTYSLLSFPPLASDCSSWDHFKPQTYCVCPVILLIIVLGLYLISRYNMVLSLDPEAKILFDQASELTLAVWPDNVWIFLFLVQSQIWTVP